MLAPTLLATLLIVTPNGDDAAAEDLKRLKGSWAIQQAAFDGKEIDDSDKGLLQFDGDVLTMSLPGGGTRVQRVRLDPSKTPREIDFEEADEKREGKGEITARGIYELKGEILQLCVGREGRPTMFSDKDAMHMVLKRKAP